VGDLVESEAVMTKLDFLDPVEHKLEYPSPPSSPCGHRRLSLGVKTVTVDFATGEFKNWDVYVCLDCSFITEVDLTVRPS
jgi:hypothetical protein